MTLDEANIEARRADGFESTFTTQLEDQSKPVETAEEPETQLVFQQPAELQVKKNDLFDEMRAEIELEAQQEDVSEQLYMLQKKHKEISERVQTILMDTVDLAINGNRKLKTAMNKNQKVRAELDDYEDFETLGNSAYS